jgi:predicted site-specific integrase-resolvase
MAIINKPSFNENQLAERWTLSVKTLQDWRRKGTGPAYLKLGKAIRYPHEVVEKYESEHMNNTEA